MSEAPLTTLKLDALEKLLEAATQGEWKAEPFGHVYIADRCDLAEFEGPGSESAQESAANCACTAALHNAGKALIAMARQKLRLEEAAREVCHQALHTIVDVDGDAFWAAVHSLDAAMKGGDDDTN